MQNNPEFTPVGGAADTTKPVLLLVDDDELIVGSLSIALGDEYRLVSAATRRDTLNLLRECAPPELVLLDLGLPPKPHDPREGLRLLRELLARDGDMKILVLSGQSTRDNVQQALSLGAADFITKPCELELLRARLWHQRTMREAERKLAGHASPDGRELLGESPVMQTLRTLITQFAKVPFPLLIEGESGTGKELVARRLHQAGANARRSYLPVNCAALPGELLEAQLFGHTRGAFTDAHEERSGFFDEVGEGTLLFDEVGELSPRLQAKLLRVLDDGYYYRLGETRTRRLRARILASTNRDLREEVRNGNFRLDLYHRLSVLTMLVPALRDRGDDRLLLFEHFRKLYTTDATGIRLSEEARTLLLSYLFPGNVRELRNVVIRLCARHPGTCIGVEQLAEELDPELRAAPDTLGQDSELRRRLLDPDFQLNEVLSRQEQRYVRVALEISGNNLSRAARLLGVNRSTLYSRLQKTPSGEDD